MENVRKEIIDNTKKSAQKIISEAEKEKEQILSQAEKRIRQKKDAIESEINNYSDEMESSLLAELDSYKKTKKLEIENSVIDDVFEQVFEKLEKLDSKKREQHIKDILAKRPKNFTNVFCSDKDTNLVKKAKTSEISGGLIVENPDGTQRIDYSYENIVSDIRKQSLGKVYKILFENEY